MSALRVKRRSFLETLPAIPVGLLAEQQKVQPSAVGVKVTAGVDRFNDVRKLPGGDLLFVKVATQDTAGAFFLTEQSISRKWAGPPEAHPLRTGRVVLLSRWRVRRRSWQSAL